MERRVKIAGLEIRRDGGECKAQDGGIKTNELKIRFIVEIVEVEIHLNVFIT